MIGYDNFKSIFFHRIAKTGVSRGQQNWLLEVNLPFEIRNFRDVENFGFIRFKSQKLILINIFVMQTNRQRYLKRRNSSNKYFSKVEISNFIPSFAVPKIFLVRISGALSFTSVTWISIRTDSERPAPSMAVTVKLKEDWVSRSRVFANDKTPVLGFSRKCVFTLENEISPNIPESLIVSKTCTSVIT